jgi:hypothetical protein
MGPATLLCFRRLGESNHQISITYNASIRDADWSCLAKVNVQRLVVKKDSETNLATGARPNI